MVATTWTGTLGLKNLSERGIIVLVKMKAGRWLTSWSLTATRTITYETSPTIPDNDDGDDVHGPMTFDRVIVDGATELASRASVALVEANPGSFFWDSSVQKLYVSMADSSTIWAHTVVADFAIYLCSGSYDKRPVFLDSALWWPRISGIGTFSRRIADIFDPRIQVPSTRIQLICGADWDNIFRLYRWKNREVQIRVGGDNLPYSEYQRVFTGDVRDARWTEEFIEFEVAGKSAAFDTSFPPDKITSTTLSTTYGVRWVGNPDTLYSIAPTTINANCATQDAEIGAPIPWVAGRGIYLRQAPLIAYASNYAMWAVGKSVMVTNVRRLNSGTTTNWVWTDTSPIAWWWYDSDDGMLYGAANASPHTADFWFTLNGPENTDVDTYPAGPNFELAPDIVQRAVSDCGITVTWDETLMDESRFLTSLMELQVYEDENTTLGEFLFRVCRSTGSIIFERGNGEIVFKTLSPDYRSYVDLDEAYGDFLQWETQVDHLDTYTRAGVGWGALTQQAFDTGVSEMVAYQECPEYAAEGGAEKSYDILGTLLKTEAGAVCLASRVARWAANHPLRIRVVSTYRHIDLDIGDTVRIVKTRKPVENDAYSMFAVVVGIGMNLEDGTVELDLIERFQSRQAYIGAASSPAWGSATADQKRVLGFLTDASGLSAASDNAAYKVSQEF